MNFRIERFGLNMTNTKYMRCQFDDDISGDGDVSLDG
jgi:hypothetical protein